MVEILFVWEIQHADKYEDASIKDREKSSKDKEPSPEPFFVDGDWVDGFLERIRDITLLDIYFL